MSLEKFQKLFVNSVLKSDDNQSLDLIEKLTPKELPFNDRIKIYQKNYLGGLAGALSEVYQTISILLGEECFYSLLHIYVKENPSYSQDLNEYGEGFPAFIAKEMAEIPYLEDVAKIDLRWHQIFYCKDDPNINQENFKQATLADPETLSFKLTHSLFVEKMNHQVLELWSEIFKTEVAPEKISISNLEENIGIWRQQYIRKVEMLNSLELKIINLINNSKNFYIIAETLESDYSQNEVGQTVGGLIHKGLIVGFELK